MARARQYARAVIDGVTILLRSRRCHNRGVRGEGVGGGGEEEGRWRVKGGAIVYHRHVIALIESAAITEMRAVCAPRAAMRHYATSEEFHAIYGA